MDAVELARITTRASAATLGALAGTGTRSIDDDGRVVHVWHTVGRGAVAVVTISKSTGRVLRARTSLGGDPSVLHTGRAIPPALAAWVDRVRW